MCAVDQKRPFFLRVGPFLDLLPFKGPFPLTGALITRPPYGKAPYTGRPPSGKAPYGQTSYGKAPYDEKDDEDAYGKAGPLWEGPLRGGTVLTGRAGPCERVPYGEGRSLREGPVLGRALTRGQGPLRKRLRAGFLRGGAAYGKAQAGPLREGKMGKSLYGKGRS